VIGALFVLIAASTTGWYVDAAFASSSSSPPSFTISGDLDVPLSPGAGQPVDLTFTNRSSSALTIAPGAVTITISTSRPTCSASANFAVTRGLTIGVTIPAHAPGVSLSALGIAPRGWPIVSMIQTDTNQDACKGVTLALRYAARAT
jgi:hypothetical protein